MCSQMKHTLDGMNDILINLKGIRMNQSCSTSHTIVPNFMKTPLLDQVFLYMTHVTIVLVKVGIRHHEQVLTSPI